MSRNTVKQEPLSEEVQEQMQDAVEEKAAATKQFLRDFFDAKRISPTFFTDNLPFISFVALLMLLYISNRHLAERTIRKIDRLSKEVKELSWDYKSLSADLMKLSTQTEIAKRVDSLGLKERLEPPIKIEVIKQKK